MEYRGYKISAQPRKGRDFVSKVTAPNGREYGPYVAHSLEGAIEKARAKVRELNPSRDLDEEPLTEEEQAERAEQEAEALRVYQGRPRRRPLSSFLGERE